MMKAHSKGHFKGTSQLTKLNLQPREIFLILYKSVFKLFSFELIYIFKNKFM